MTFQLRKYAVKPGALEQFLSEWRSSVVPLRRKYGFHVVGAWRSADERTFVWMVRHDGPESFEEANDVYYASEDRKAMAADPARHLDGYETVELVAVDVEG